MLKPVKRNQTISVVSVHDSAIDMDRSPKTETEEGDETLLYVAERSENPGCWREHLIIHDGAIPTQFVIGIVPSSELNRIDDECRLHDDMRWRELCWRCFLHGVRDIEGFGVDRVPKEKIDGVDYVSAAWLKKTFVGGLRAVAIEIGSLIWRWNMLQEADIKN